MCVALGCGAPAEGGPDPRPVPPILNGVPEEARDAILAEAAGRPVAELELRVVDGVTVYRASWLVDGEEVRFEVSIPSDGALDDREDESQE